MLQLAFRSFFFIAVILGYSTGIWRLINDYFRHEFQSYLEQESKANKYILQDPPAKAREVAEASQQSSAAPLRLDEVIVNVGRTFADRGGGGGAKAGPEGNRRKVTNSISEMSNSIVDSGGVGGVGGGLNVGCTVPEEEGTTTRLSDLGNGKEPAINLPTSQGEPGEYSSASSPTQNEKVVARVIAAEAAEVTEIRQAPGGEPNLELQPDESEGDKWISYWERRGRGYRDAVATPSPRFCPIAAQPSGENPSSGFLWRSPAACGGQEAGNF